MILTPLVIFDVKDDEEAARGLNLDAKAPPAGLEKKQQEDWADSVQTFRSDKTTLVNAYNDFLKESDQGLKGAYQVDTGRYPKFDAVRTLLRSCQTLVELGGEAAAKASGPDSLNGLVTLEKLLKFGQSI